ncbi:hypothetical protein ACIRF8_10695 [Streptomyces sp. NPDC102406]|uniref:hypothetical protein n=1 Tax=Streptomyces sp. NPDC102406 TaxID=3366171 RepID=UPI0037FB6D03
MRKTIRTRFLAAGGVAAVLTLAAVTPALAGPADTGKRGVAAAPTAQGDPRSTTDRVAHFYGAYIDAVWDNEDAGSAAQTKALRGFYLSAAAQKKVAAFEAREHADGILFAQNVPVKWAVTYTGSGAGHSTALVTLTWNDGKNPDTTKIKVQSDLTTRKITDLAPVG